MIKYRESPSIKYTIESIICDLCGKEYDDFEIQEFHHIDFIGGYKSIFGDEEHVCKDICQYCLFEILNGKCK
jgi:hypothetical protein